MACVPSTRRLPPFGHRADQFGVMARAEYSNGSSAKGRELIAFIAEEVIVLNRQLRVDDVAVPLLVFRAFLRRTVFVPSGRDGGCFLFSFALAQLRKPPLYPLLGEDWLAVRSAERRLRSVLT